VFVAANRSRERFAIDPDFSVQERSEPQIMALQEGRELVALRLSDIGSNCDSNCVGTMPDLFRGMGCQLSARSLLAETLTKVLRAQRCLTP